MERQRAVCYMSSPRFQQREPASTQKVKQGSKNIMGKSRKNSQHRAGKTLHICKLAAQYAARECLVSLLLETSGPGEVLRCIPMPWEQFYQPEIVQLDRYQCLLFFVVVTSCILGNFPVFIILIWSYNRTKSLENLDGVILFGVLKECK